MRGPIRARKAESPQPPEVPQDRGQREPIRHRCC